VHFPPPTSSSPTEEKHHTEGQPHSSFSSSVKGGYHHGRQPASLSGSPLSISEDKEEPSYLGQDHVQHLEDMVWAQGRSILDPLLPLLNPPSTPTKSPAKSPPPPRLSCSLCDRTYGRKGDLDRHFRSHFDTDRFYCGVSSCRFGVRGFHRRDKLEDHLRRGHGMKV
jgi:hypothetical protein